jgi:tyrosinase
MYQAIRYNGSQYWFPNNNAAEDSTSTPTFTVQGNGNPANYDSSYEPLTPFNRMNDGSQPWTSDRSRFTKTFGYTYPEIQDWNYINNPDGLAKTVTVYINTHWAPPGITPSKVKRGVAVQTVKTGKMDQYQYFVAISVSRYALPMAYTITCFLGTPPADVSQWSNSPYLAGALPVFPPVIGQPKSKTNRRVHGEIPLQDGIHKAGYGDKDYETVIAYLKEKLLWRVQNSDGTVFESLKGLKVRVFARGVELPDDVTGFPKYRERNYLPDVTKGKNGG